jgi:hypothetical protein
LVVVVPPPYSTVAPEIAAPAEFFTVPVIVPKFDESTIGGTVVVAPAATVTVAVPFANPEAEAVTTCEPPGTFAIV